MSAVHYLFPRGHVNLIDIHPLRYELFLQEVLAHEAAVCLIKTDLDISREEAIKVFRQSCGFGKLKHSSDSSTEPDVYENHIRAALKRSRSTRHDNSAYRRWIALSTPLWIDDWLKIGAPVAGVDLTDKEMHIKQEEMDMDPFADGQVASSSHFVGTGSENDPIIFD